ncbi:T9SS type A sorting domain-containing protein [uncultured Draconibacterium sp.]|uniref:T9SS type A sorting domain-containing protein n=1 Tax=uncultured Draconibacterium sp. TaxID=1573823 RepID=UPI003216F002
MKQLFILVLASTLFLTSKAQVTLDRTYNYSTTVVKLETNGYKYYLMDVPNAQCRIYNLDHSLFKTINCSVPNNFYLADIKYVSEKLFDNDSGIELVYTYYKYNNSAQYYEYDSKIINEDGSAITTIDGARYVYVNQTEANTYKVFAYCYDYSVFPEIIWTNIYSLPGEPVSAFAGPETTKNNFVNVFPNPATNTVKVAYKLPENINEGTLYLIDNSGNTVNQYIVDTHTDHLSISVNELASGVYHYFIAYNNTKTDSKKLVVR